MDKDLPSILLVVGHDRNRELLTRYLEPDYMLLFPEQRTVPPFDLCVADPSGLERYGRKIYERKQASEDVFLPCLLLRRTGDREITDAEWAIIDDVIGIPVNPTELDLRLLNMLERRDQSATLAAQKDRQIRAQEAFTETTIDALPDVFYVFDADGSLRRWNHLAVEVTGYDDSELSSMHTMDFLPENDKRRFAAIVMRMLEEGGSRLIESDLVTKAGEAIPYEFKVAPLYTPDGRIDGGVGIGRDITDRRVRRELARQNERLDKFASIVSHDLRNPLSVATGFLELAEQDCESPHHEHIGEALDRMAELIDDLLELARQGQVVGDAGAVVLSAAVSVACENIDSAGGTVDVVSDGQILADEARLCELFENLFRNCLEHGVGSTSDPSSLTVEVGLLEDGFYVADNGPGIPESKREQVFEYGYTTDPKGTGFGLAIVREIAAAHGWSVRVTESESGGAKFEFSSVERLVDGEPN